MKTKCYLCIAFSFLTGLFLQRANAQANTQLSNLVSPTKINQSLLPNNDNTRNLGSATRSWKDVYLDGSLYLAGLRFLSNGGNLFGLNVFIGSSAGLNTTTGINNTAGGHVALFKNKVIRFIPTLPETTTPLMDMRHFITTPDLQTPLMDMLHFITTSLDIQTPLVDRVHFIPTPPEITTPLMEEVQVHITT